MTHGQRSCACFCVVAPLYSYQSLELYERVPSPLLPHSRLRLLRADILMHYCSSLFFLFFFSSRRRHTRYWRDWSSDVCSSDLWPPTRDPFDPHLASARDRRGRRTAAGPDHRPTGGRRKPGHAGDRDLVSGALQALPPWASVRDRPGVDLRARDPLQAGPRRPERLAGGAGMSVVQRFDYLGRVPRVGEAPRVLLPARPGAERGAGSTVFAGPGAVRGLLRPDADPVLLPDRDVGNGRTRTGHDEAGRLHAGRVVLHAGWRDRHRRSGLEPARDAAHVRALLAPAPAAISWFTGVDLPGLRRGLPGQDAADPVPRLAGRRI